MIRIRKVTPIDDFLLQVVFDDGKSVEYDTKEDMHLPGYSDLMDVPGLFRQVQIDESRTCIVWNDYIDLPSDTIYEYGRSLI